MENNIFQDIPNAIPEEIIETMLKTDKIRIERILSAGQQSPPDFWYDQNESEWVLLLHGYATLVLKEPLEMVNLKPGDFIHIPAHRPHRVESTATDEVTVWLAVYY